MRLDRYLDDVAAQDWLSATEGTIRFALVGLGWWARDEVIPALAESDRCDPTVMVSSSKEKATSLAAEVESAETGLTYDEFHDGAASDAYDAVYVCTPNAVHLPYVRTAATLGKAALCEKPMAATVDQAREMQQVCAEEGVPLMIAYRLQAAPEIRHARRLIQDGFIGDPVQVLSDYSQTLLSVIPDPDQWRLDPEMTGYGTTVMDIGLYSINTTRFLLDSDPVAVQATMQSVDDAFADVPDEHVAYTVEFADGTLASCTASQNAQESTSLRITGTEGQIVVEPAFTLESQLRLRRGDTTAALETPETNQVRAVFDLFADRLLTDSDDHPDGRDGLVDMRTMQAIYDAAESGQRTPVETDP